MDAILLQSPEHQKLEQEIDRRLNQLEEAGLTREQGHVVDELLTANNEESAYCCKVFYQQGMKDCVALLKEIGVLEGTKRIDRRQKQTK